MLPESKRAEQRNIEFLESSRSGGGGGAATANFAASAQSCFFPGLPGKESRKIEVRLGRGSILSTTN